MSPSDKEYREELVDRIDHHRERAAAFKVMAADQTDMADALVKELNRLDTPELPNLFPPCPTNPPTESPPSEN